MPSFVVQLPNLQASGPLVDIRVLVGLPVEQALQRAGAPVPSPVAVKAMIDTGATASVIDPNTARLLGLQPVGVVAINTPSSTNVPCPQYVVRFLFPNNVLIQVIAIETPLQGQQIQCLIGRDVLALGVLVYTGYINQFSFSL